MLRSTLGKLSLIFFTALLPLVSLAQNQALDLSGAGNEVNVTYNLDTVNGFTVEQWVYIPTLSAGVSLINQSSANFPAPLDAYVNASGAVNLLLGNGSGSFTSNLTAGGAITAGTWHHIAIVFDPASVGTEGQIYIDGNSTAAATVGRPASMAYAGPLRIGRRADAFEGDDMYVDEVRVWSTARDGATIATDYNRSIDINATNLDVYLRFDNDLTDANGGDHPGSIAAGSIGYTAGAPLINSALTFDGSAGFYPVGNLGTFPTQGAFEAWINVGTYDNNHGVVDSDIANTGSGFRIETNSAGDLYLYIDEQGVIHNFYTGASVPTSTWAHIAFTWDVDQDSLSGYLNGQKVFNVANTSWPANLPDVSLGQAFNTDATRKWDGLIDEVRVWGSTRLGSDIAANYNNYLADDETGLLYYNSFPDGSETLNAGVTWADGNSLDDAPAINLYNLFIKPQSTEAEAKLSIEAPNNLYYVITNSATQPSADQILNGQNHTGSTAYNYFNYGSFGSGSLTDSVSIGNSAFTNGNDLLESTTYYTYWLADADGSASTTRDQSEILAEVFTTLTPSDITMATLAVTGGDVAPGSLDNLIYKFQMDVANADAEVQGMLFDFVGSVDSLDFVLGGFQLYQNSIDDFGSATEITPASDYDSLTHPGGGDIAWLWSQTYTTGSTTYFWITADISASATVGDSLAIELPLANTNFGFVDPKNVIDGGLAQGSTFTISASTADNALAFDGTDDHVSGTGINLASTNFTIETWFDTESPTVSQTLFSVGSVNSNNQALHISLENTDVKIGFFFDDILVPYAVDTGWHHLAVTHNATTRESTLYIDGVFVGSGTHTGNFTGNTNYEISQNGWSTSGYVNGQMDELRVWNSIRTQEEIGNNRYNELDAGVHADLVAYFQFNETSGTTVTDSKNGNDGTWNGSGGGAYTEPQWVASDALTPPPTLTEDFETYTINSNFVTLTTGDYHNNNATSETGIVLSGTRAMRLGLTGTVTTPLIDGTQNFTYWHSLPGAGQARVTIEKSVNGGDYVVVATPLFTNTSFVQDTVFLAEGAGSGVRLRFTVDQVTSTQDWIIDDLQFRQYTAGNTYAPVLANVFAYPNSTTVDADISVDIYSDLYYVITTSSTMPDTAQVKAGTDEFDVQAPTSGSISGVVGPSNLLLGDNSNGPNDNPLTPGQTYYLYWIAEESNNLGNISEVDSVSFTTEIPSVIAIKTEAIAGGSLGQGSNDNIIYKFSLDIADADAGMEGFFFTPIVSDTADFSKFRFYESAGVDDFGSSTVIDSSDFFVSHPSGLPDGSIGFLPGSARILTAPQKYYYYVTADVTPGASVGDSIQIDAPVAGSNFGFSDPKTVLDSGLVAGAVYTISSPVAPPIAPTNVVAYPIAGGTDIQIDWTDNATDETGYRIDRADDYAFTTNVQVVDSTLAANDTTYVFTAGIDQPYFYRVTATNGGEDITSQSSAVFATTEGFPVRALTFDGVDDQVTFADSLLPTGTSPRTAEMWVRTTTADQNRYFFSYGTNTTNQDFALGVSVTGTLIITQNGNNVQSTAQINDGSWHHVAVSYNGSTYQLYVDGVPDGSGAMTTSTTLSGTAYLGRFVSGSNGLAGDLDEVKVWNFNKTDFSDRYASLNGNESGLVTYFKLDELAGDTTVDHSINSLPGTLQNGPVRITSDFLQPNVVYNTNNGGSGSLRATIEYANANPGTVITFNIAEAAPWVLNLTTALPQITADSTVIDASTQPGFSFGTTNGMVQIDGSSTSGDGLSIAAANVEIYGLHITNWNSDGISTTIGSSNVQIGAPGKGNVISSGTRGISINSAPGGSIQSNYVGTTVDGLGIDANSSDGVVISSSPNFTVGGSRSLGEGNVISGNGSSTHYGLEFTSSDSVRIFGNYIGTDANGSNDLGNIRGINIASGSDTVQIGSSNPDHRNIISGNNGTAGVLIQGGTHVRVENNYIGLDSAGNTAISNGGDGIRLVTSGAGMVFFNNVIAANTSAGIALDNITSNVIVDSNQIGTRGDGTAVPGFGAGSHGIALRGVNGADNNLNRVQIINNVIAGNGNGANENGINFLLGNQHIVVEGNWIGLAADSIALGNFAHGISISDATDSVKIGGAGVENVIAHNANSGIFFNNLSTDNNNDILENSIYCNGVKGIEFGNAPTVPTPVIQSVSPTEIVVNATVEDGTPVTIYQATDSCSSDQGTVIVASDIIVSNTATISGSFITGNTYTAIVNDANNGISEFSAPDSIAASLVTNTNDAGPGSLRNAIDFANANPGTTITFDIPSGPYRIDLQTALADITAAGTVIDGTTLAGWTFSDTANMVTINGSALGSNVPGLTINNVANVEIYGLVLTGFTSISESVGAIQVTGDGADNAIIGAPNKGNILHGMVSSGITISDADSLTIQSNWLGTLNGTTRSEINKHGIYGTGVTDNMLIGGNSLAGEGNLISGAGNGRYGVNLSVQGTNLRIQGNLIGTDSSGMNSIYNEAGGLSIGGAVDITLGGPNPGEENVISGNNTDINADGINIGNSTTGIIMNNLIGLAADGSTPLGNGAHGIVLEADNGLIITENVISSNALQAIKSNLGFSNVDIVNNIIGMDSSAVLLRPNGGGIQFGTGTGNRIGYVGNPNIIAGNTGAAIDITGSATENTFVGNQIFGNGSGILLAAGANGNIAAPSIGAADTASVSGSGPEGAIIHLYQSDSLGQGGFYLDSAVVSGGTWSISGLSLVLGDSVVATSTDYGAGLGTSTFSSAAVVAPIVAGVVTNVNDAGSGSLRAAIDHVNASVSKDTITFNIPGPGPWVISPVTALPTIDNTNDVGMVIDATTQPGWAFGDSSTMVTIEGITNGGVGNGLTIAEPNVEVYGLVITGFNTDGIQVNAGSNNLVIGAPGKGNVISNNSAQGIDINGAPDGIIQGNRIGTSVDGLADYGNSTDGMNIVASNGLQIGGDATLGEGNLISGNNQDGVQLETSDSVVFYGNYIGLDSAGTNDLGNGNGLNIRSGNVVTVGGFGQGQRNVISGNSGGDEIVIAGTASNVTIENNIIGLNYNGTAAVELQSGRGISFNTSGTGHAIRGNIVSGHTASGIEIYNANTAFSIENNFIGTDITGKISIPNGTVGNGSGLLIDDSNGADNGANRIQILDNVISGNGDGTADHGILFTGINTNILIQRNKIGVDVDSLVLGNAGDGIRFTSSTTAVTVGGPGNENIIANNGGDGIFFSGSDNSLGNIIDLNQIYCNTGKGISFSIAPTVEAPKITQITGSVIAGLSTAPQNSIVRIYESNDGCNNDQGFTYLGNAVVQADSTWSFGGAFNQNLPHSAVIVEDGTNNISEFFALQEFLVSSVADSGANTLRQAITDANATVNINPLIEFNIGGGGAQTISLSTALPQITREGLIIDGTTQPGWDINTGAMVTIDGTSVGSGNGIDINTTNVEIYGLEVSNFPGAGIATQVFATGIILGEIGKGNVVNNNSGRGMILGWAGTIVEGNRIGTNAEGTAAAPNSGGGLAIANSTTVNANLISGHAGDAIFSNTGSGHTITNNFIGTDISGSFAIPNDQGIVIVTGGNSLIEGNVISGNTTAGIWSSTGFNGNEIINNIIGLDSAGMDTIPNGVGILFAGGSGNHIGRVGNPNIIAGNSAAAIQTTSGASSENTFVGNAIYGNGAGIVLAAGANGDIAAPSIDSLTASQASGTGPEGAIIHLYLDSLGQGQTYLDSAVVSGGTWTIGGLSLVGGDAVVATSTDYGAGAGTSTFSATAGLTPPLAASGLIAYASSGTDVTLEWVDNATNETSYSVERATDAIFTSPVVVASGLPANTTTHIDNAGSDQQFFYRVLPVNGFEDGSSYSEGEFVTTRVYPGNTIDLNGTNQLVSATLPDGLPTGTTPFTVEAWVKPDVHKLNDVVTGWGTVGIIGQLNQLSLTAGETYAYGLKHSFYNRDIEYETANLAGEWHHVAVTWDGVNRTLYLDGVPLGTDAPTSVNVQYSAINIGGYFDGQMDEVKIWNDSVKTDFSDRYAPINGNEPKLIGYWKFDGTSGGQVYDNSVNNNTGNLTGTPTPGVTNSTVPTDSLNVTVTYPNGGEVFDADSVITITWDDNFNGSDLIEIRHSTDSGATSYIVNDGIFSTYNGSYSWTVPSNAGPNNLIIISNTSLGRSDTSDAVFTINVPPSVTVDYPNGGEVFAADSVVNISWTDNFNGSDLIEIRLSTDGGASSFILNDGIFSTYAGNYAWTVPSTPGANNLIIISNTTLGVSDTSDAVFTINLAVPNAPSNLFTTEVNSNQIDLSWSDNSSTETAFAIFRSTGNTGSFTEIATTSADTTFFVDNTVAADSNYFYQVVARNGSGDSGPTNTKAAATFTPPGNALTFDGIDDNIDAGNDPSLDFSTGDFSISLWYNRNNAGNSNDRIIYKGASILETQAGYTIFGDTSQVTFMIGDGTSRIGVTANGLEPNRWYYLVATRSGSNMNLYVDGVLSASRTDGLSGSISNLGQSLFIGGLGSSLFFPGQLDEIAIWSKELAPGEIASLANSGLVGNEADLQAYYKFDQTDGAITVLPDRSTNQNDGTLNNFGGVASWNPSGALTIPPSVTVDYPNGGEVFAADSVVNISWTDNFNGSDLIEIRLSTDGGASSFILNDGIFSTYAGNYAWTVPNTPGANNLIIISNTSLGISDTSNAVFTINPPAATAPLAPSDLAVYAISPTDVRLDWTDNATDETGYLIERADDFGFTINVQLIDSTLAANDSTYIFNAGTDQPYFYRVTATNGSEDASSRSNVEFATTRPFPGYAVDFTAQDNEFDLGDPASINFGSGDFTVETWYKVHEPDSNIARVLLHKDQGVASGNRQLLLQYDRNSDGNDKSLYFVYFTSGDNGAAIKTPANAITDTLWHHIAVVRNGNSFEFYVDGTLSASGITEGAHGTMVDATQPLGIGGNPTAGGGTARGLIDEVRFWNYARTQTEIQDFRYQNLSGIEAGLVAYYPMDEGNGSVTVDQTSSVNDGFNTGSAMWMPSTILDTLTGPQEILVTGLGVEIVSGDATPDFADGTNFGDGGISHPVVQTFVITNTGGSVLTLGSNAVGASGDTAFEAGDQPAETVAPGDSTTFTIVFTAPNTGPYNSQVQINSDDADESFYTFNVTGNGVPAAPSQQANTIVVTNVTDTTADLSWTFGNGWGTAIAMYAGSDPFPAPMDSTTYTANAQFGLGDQMGAGWHVVYVGTGTSVSVTGLTSGQDYTVAALEFYGNAGEELYNINTDTLNPLSFVTTGNSFSFFEDFDSGLPLSQDPVLFLPSGTWTAQGVQSDETFTGARGGSGDAAWFQAGIGNNLTTPPLDSVDNFSFWYRVDNNIADGFVFDVLASSSGDTSNFDIVIADNVTKLDQTYQEFTHTFGATYSGPIRIQFDGSGDSNGFIDDFGADGTVAAPAPTITINFPGGGESFQVNDTIHISWTDNFNPGDLLRVSYSSNAGATWVPLDSATAGTYGGMYDWIAPGDSTTQALIEVFNVTEAIGATSSLFNLNQTITPNAFIQTLSVPGGPLNQGTVNNLVYAFSVNATGGSITMEGFQATLQGTFDTLDFTPNGWKIYQNITEDDFGGAALLNSITYGSIVPDTLAIPFTSVVPDGNTYYYYVSVDIDSAANAGNNFAVTLVSPFLESFGVQDPKNKFDSGLFDGDNFNIENAGPPNFALDFDGSNDFVQLPAIPLDPSVDNFTVELWAKTDVFTGTNNLFIQEDGTGTGRAYLYLTGNNLASLLGGSSTIGATALSLDTWYHFAVTYDGANVTLYVDGVLEAQQPRTPESTDGQFRLGISKAGASPHDGQIDDVRIWNFVKTDTDIINQKDHYLNGDESGLLAYYNLQDGPGATGTIDASSNGYDGVLTNMDTLNAWVPGPPLNPPVGSPVTPDYALEFDGSTQYVGITDAPEFDIDTDWTIEAWIKTPSTGQQNIISQINGSTGYAFFKIGGNLYFQYYSSGGFNNGGTALGAGGGIDDDQWHHIAVSQNGSNGKLYVDGVVIQDMNSMNPVDESVGDIRFGYDSFVGALTGSLDEVRFWDYQRSDTEVANSHNVKLNGNEAGLVAYYRFDDGPGSTILSDQIAGNSGALVSMDENTDWVDGANLGEPGPTVFETFDGGLPATVGLPIDLSSATWTGQGIQSAAVIDTTFARNSSDAAYMFAGAGNHLTTPYLTNVNEVSFWYRADTTAGGSFDFVVYGSSDEGATFTVPLDSAGTSGSGYLNFNIGFGPYNGPIRIAYKDATGTANGIIDDFDTDGSVLTTNVSLSTLAIGPQSGAPGDTAILAYKIRADISVTSATSEGFFLTPQGAFSPTDFANNGFSIYHNVGVDSLENATLLGKTNIASGDPIIPDGSVGLLFSENYPVDTSVYFYVTVDLDAAATGGNSFFFGQPNTEQFGFANSDKFDVGLAPGDTVSITGSCDIPVIGTTITNNTFCVGGDGSVTANPSSTVEPSSYLIQIHQGIDTTGTIIAQDSLAVDSLVATGLVAGDYTIRVVNNDLGCSAITTVSVGNAQDAPTINVPSVNISDESAPAAGDGQLDASAAITGGTGAYKFEWYSDPGLTTLVDSTAIISGLTGGTYYLTVSDSITNCSSGVEAFTINTLAGDPEIAVFGNGQEILTGDNTPDLVDGTEFGNVLVGDSLVRSYIIYNLGSGPLDISSVGASGDTAFEVISGPTSGVILAAGDSVLFEVMYKPLTDLVNSSEIQIFNDDPDEGFYGFWVGGTGVLGDVTPPNVTGVSTNVSVVTDATVQLQVFVSFDEAMDTTVAPSVTFPVETSAAIAFNSGFWSDNFNYTAIFNTTDGNETINDFDIRISGGQDVIGNVMADHDEVDVFTVDTENPVVTSIVRSNADPTNQTTLNFSVTFSETVSDVEIGDFGISTSGTSGTIASVSASTGTNFTVTVNSVTGNGTLRLDYLNSNLDGVADANGNPSEADFVSGESYTIDNTLPIVSVNALSTSITSPSLTGTIDDATATIDVTVNGVTYAATNNGATWTLAQGVISPSLTNGTYEIAVAATDLAGNVGTDSTSNELFIRRGVVGLTVDTVTSTTVSVSWTAGFDVDFYRLDVSTEADFSSFVSGYNAAVIAGETATVTGLDYSVDYYFRVRLVNTIGQVSGNSAMVKGRTIRDAETASDSVALRQIYDALAGPSWTTSVNWTVDYMRDWDGITMDASRTRVREVSINGFGAAGDMPTTFTGGGVGGLTAMETLRVNNNSITSLLDFSITPALTTLNVANNILEFDDLEPLVGNFATLNYNNQANVQFEEYIPGTPIEQRYNTDFLLNIGTDGVGLGGTSNVYSIYRNDTLLTASDDVIPGSQTLIVAIGYHNMGTYRAEVTSPLVPGLTITVDPQIVYAVADMVVTVLDASGNGLTTSIDGYMLETTRRARGFDTLEAVFNQVPPTFNFPNVVLGDYILAVNSDPELYIPTYFGDVFEWTEADTLFFRSDDGITINITQVPQELTAADGEGELQVLIEEDFGEEDGRISARRRAAKRKCGLRRKTGGGRVEQGNDGFELIAYGETDDNGEFKFGFLPQGVYRFFVEYPGIPLDESSFVEFEVGEKGVSDTDFKLEAFVTEDGIEVTIEAILGVILEYFKDLQIYPNPSSDYLNISYRHLKSADVSAELVDMTGRTMWSTELRNGFDGMLRIDVTDFDDGMYILRFYDRENPNDNVVTFRVIVKD